MHASCCCEFLGCVWRNPLHLNHPVFTLGAASRHDCSQYICHSCIHWHAVIVFDTLCDSAGSLVHRRYMPADVRDANLAGDAMQVVDYRVGGQHTASSRQAHVQKHRLYKSPLYESWSTGFGKDSWADPGSSAGRWRRAVQQGPRPCLDRPDRPVRVVAPGY